MKHFPKMEFPTFDLSKIKLGGFGASGSAEDEGKRAARAARITAAMGRFQRRQADAFARWTEARDRPAEPAGSTTIDMEVPQSPGGAWTAPDPAAAPSRASVATSCSCASSTCRRCCRLGPTTQRAGWSSRSWIRWGSPQVGSGSTRHRTERVAHLPTRRPT